MGKFGNQPSEAFHFLTRVPASVFCPIQPKEAAGLGREMPIDDVTHMGVELGLGCLDGIGGWGVQGREVKLIKLNELSRLNEWQ